MTETRASALYDSVKEMTVNFAIRPGERINEGALARQLDASRTPLREALNRLVAERLIDFRPGTGFFCRALEAQDIYDLYELRRILEVAAIAAACDKGSDADIAAIRSGPFAQDQDYQGRTIAEIVARDEAFHLALARLSSNAELVRQLAAINERIRFIRWIDMGSRATKTKGEHSAILDAVEARDAARAGNLMSGHISRRMDQIVAAVREGYSSIYMEGPEQVFGRRVTEET